MKPITTSNTKTLLLKGVLVMLLQFVFRTSLLAQAPCPPEVINVPSLIPNPSFESFNCCPYTFSQLNCADDWVQASDATSDYLNTCGYVFSAATDIGLSPPHGNGMAGFISNESYREYIGSCLLSTMNPGTTYQLQMQMASTPITNSGSTCDGGVINYAPLNLTVWGTSSCLDLPFAGTGCPTTGGWHILGTTLYTPVSAWGVITVTFTPTVPINAFAIGPPCGTLPAGYNSSCFPYFYVDNIILNSLNSFQSSLTQTGTWCNNNLQLIGEIKAGATYQWFFNNNPIAGQTTPTLNVSALGLPDGDYTLQTTVGGTCSSVTETVVEDSPSVPTITQAGPYCGTASITTTLVASSGGGVWSGNGITNTTTGEFNPLVAGVGNHLITYSIGGVCPVSATSTIHIGSSPVALTQVLSDASACVPGLNGSAAITMSVGTAPYQYNWQLPPVGGQGQSLVTGLSVGVHTVTITDALNCGTTATVGITAASNVSLTATASTITCVGASTGSIVANAVGGLAPYTYSWSPNVNGQGTATANALSAGVYTVNVMDNSCSNPSGIELIQNGNFNNGLTGFTTGYTAATQGTVMVLSDPTVLHPLFVGTDHTNGAGSFVCVNGDVGNNNTNVVCQTVAVIPNTNYMFSAWFSTLYNANPAVIDISFNGVSFNPFQLPSTTNTWSQFFTTWNSGVNTSVDICITDTSIISNGNDFGIDDISLQQCYGCAAVQTVTVTELPPVTLSIAGIDATCNNLCNGQTIVIPSGGTSPYTYAWSSGCTAASCSSLCAGSYSVTVKDTYSCTATATTVVNEPSAITLTTSAVAAHCNHPDGASTLTVSGGTPAYTQTWVPTGGTGLTASNLLPGTYTVNVLDDNLCPATATVIVGNLLGVVASVTSVTNANCFNGTDGAIASEGLGGFTPYTYSWSPNGGAAATATNLAQGDYTVTITDSQNCVSTATATVSEPSLLTVSTTTVNTLCIGQNVTLNAIGNGGTPNYNYVWYDVAGNAISSTVTPTVTSAYSVIATDSHSCVSTAATVTVPVYLPLSITASGATSVCPTNTTVLSSVATGGDGNYFYTWTPSTVSSVTTATTTANPGNVTTVYTVAVHDGCTTPVANSTVQVVVFPTPVVTFSANRTLGCEELCVTFNGNSVPSSVSCDWDFGDGQTSNSSCGNINHCYGNDGSYSVSMNVVDVNNCPGSGSVTNYITVYPLPLAEFSYNPTVTDVFNPYIYFNNESYGGMTYDWLFGDLIKSHSILENPYFAYADSGCYDVQLIVKTNFGCLDTVTHPVCINGAFNLYVPNAFTPNEDGVNDLFMPVGIGVDTDHYEFMVFDRWGEQIFTTRVWGEGWNGKVKSSGDIAPIGVYIWKVKCKDIYAKEHSLVGHVTIIK